MNGGDGKAQCGRREKHSDGSADMLELSRLLREAKTNAKQGRVERFLNERIGSGWGFVVVVSDGLSRVHILEAPLGKRTRHSFRLPVCLYVSLDRDGEIIWP